MGLGSPEDIVKAVGNGIDVFDSVYPTRNARHGLLFTRKGCVKITHARHAKDLAPVDKECGCEVCKTHSRAYLHHLFKTNEPLHYTLATYHNVSFMLSLFRDMREAIVEGRYQKFMDEFLKRYSIT
jgi:queuine tRNA-ribosyltransferase